MLQFAPSLHVNEQLPSGHAQLHCCPSVQTWPPEIGPEGPGPGGGIAPGGGPLEYIGGGGLGDATHATRAIREDRKQSFDMGPSESSAVATVTRAMVRVFGLREFVQRSDITPTSAATGHL